MQLIIFQSINFMSNVEPSLTNQVVLFVDRIAVTVPKTDTSLQVLGDVLSISVDVRRHVHTLSLLVWLNVFNNNQKLYAKLHIFYDMWHLTENYLYSKKFIFCDTASRTMGHLICLACPVVCLLQELMDNEYRRLDIIHIYFPINIYFYFLPR